MASGLEIVIHHGRDFERLLTDQMKAEGSGLGEKLKTDMFDHSSQDSGDAFGGTDSGMMDDTFSSFDDM